MSEMSDDEFTKAEKKLVDKYFLVRKRDWYWWIGGAGAFLVAYFALNYTTTLQVLSSDVAKKTRASIEETRAAAEADAAALKQKLNEAEEALKRIRRLANVSDQPTKVVIPIEGVTGKFASVMSYWGTRGSASAGPHPCNFKPEPRAGFEIVTKLGSGVREGIRPECAIPAGHCDSAGEYCIYSPVEQACYVNSDWLAWYRSYLKTHGLEKYFNEQRVCQVL